MLVKMFYIQLIFLFLYVINQYVDLLFQQFLHLILKLIVKHHELLDVVAQKFKKNFLIFLMMLVFDAKTI